MAVVDASALAFGVGALAANELGDSPSFDTVAVAMGLAASATLFVGAPAVHLAHEREGRALASLGVRSAPLLVTTGLLVRYLTTPGEHTAEERADFRHLAWGVTLALEAVVVGIDYAVLARDDAATTPYVVRWGAAF